MVRYCPHARGVHLRGVPHAQWVPWGVAVPGDSIQPRKGILENFLGLAKRDRRGGAAKGAVL